MDSPSVIDMLSNPALKCFEESGLYNLSADGHVQATAKRSSSIFQYGYMRYPSSNTHSISMVYRTG